MAEKHKHSCESAAQTLEWIKAIADFINPYFFLINAHVVNFFKDRLWEGLDQEWVECLRMEPVANLLLIPSGVVQEHWPDSLKEFVIRLKSLVFPRKQVDLEPVLKDFNLIMLSSVLSQGMNSKKKHEVEVLSAVVNSVANTVGPHTIVDVGAGQGYLAQVLSFHYMHSVVAIDACSHHGKITDARAERIKKHYSAQRRKLGVGAKNPNVPKTLTCRVMSADMLKALTASLVPGEEYDQPQLLGNESETDTCRKVDSSYVSKNGSSLVLAGLHACGDLSVTMLKSLIDCEEVKAVISIGCCYNLLSEEGSEKVSAFHGYPLSCGVKSLDLSLGKNARDLACQSAERWSSLKKDAGLQNFELHAFRAAFQMVLCRYFPEVVERSPSIGRQGKALRRQQQRRLLESQSQHGDDAFTSLSEWHSKPEDQSLMRFVDSETGSLLDGSSLHHAPKSDEKVSTEKFLQFEKFSRTGLSRLGVITSDDIDLHAIWEEFEPYTELIGPYWSLRAAIGPVLETLILLDRLLFLQEQGDDGVEAVMLPIFDPAVSPRNVAIIARKIDR